MSYDKQVADASDVENYDPEALEAAFQDADDWTAEGTIIDLTDTTAREVYGDKAQDPDRPGLLTTVDSDDVTFTEFFSLPVGPKSWHNARFKLGRYRREYGKLPEQGDRVRLTMSDDGYHRIYLGGDD